MKKEIVVLGGGTGGTLTANRLRKRLSVDEASITVGEFYDIAAGGQILFT